jgi:hypothetical protein
MSAWRVKILPPPTKLIKNRINPCCETFTTGVNKLPKVVKMVENNALGHYFLSAVRETA